MPNTTIDFNDCGYARLSSSAPTLGRSDNQSNGTISLPILDVDAVGITGFRLDTDVDETILPLPSSTGEILNGFSGDLEFNFLQITVLASIDQIDITWPTPLVEATCISGTVANGLAELYRILYDGATGVGSIQPAFVVEGLLQQELTLPLPEVSATVISGTTAKFDEYLPLPVVASNVLNGNVYSGAIELPLFSVVSSESYLEVSLPIFEVAAVSQLGAVAVASITLPVIEVASTGKVDALYNSLLSLPVFEVASTAVGGIAASIGVTLQAFTVRSVTLNAPIATVQIELPILEVSSAFYGEYPSAIVLEIPLIRLDGVIDNESGFTTNAVYAMNIINAAVTEYTNYGFNSFAKFGSAVLGANSSGLYLLSGDTDNGTEISAEIRSGMFDFGSSLYKRVTTAYIGYEADGTVMLTVTTDTTEFKYLLPALQKTSVHTNKHNLAKGVRSRYWQFGLKNIDGADFSLDTIEAIPVILNRRIG